MVIYTHMHAPTYTHLYAQMHACVHTYRHTGAHMCTANIDDLL